MKYSSAFSFVLLAPIGPENCQNCRTELFLISYLTKMLRVVDIWVCDTQMCVLLFFGCASSARIYRQLWARRTQHRASTNPTEQISSRFLVDFQDTFYEVPVVFTHPCACWLCLPDVLCLAFFKLSDRVANPWDQSDPVHSVNVASIRKQLASSQ